MSLGSKWCEQTREYVVSFTLFNLRALIHIFLLNGSFSSSGMPCVLVGFFKSQPGTQHFTLADIWVLFWFRKKSSAACVARNARPPGIIVYLGDWRARQLFLCFKKGFGILTGKFRVGFVPCFSRFGKISDSSKCFAQILVDVLNFLGSKWRSWIQICRLALSFSIFGTPKKRFWSLASHPGTEHFPRIFVVLVDFSKLQLRQVLCTQGKACAAESPPISHVSLYKSSAHWLSLLSVRS